MKRISKILTLAATFALAIAAHASSHREALAILNEPCADNTDTYAWVSNGAHDKLYLIMDFNPLHEPGQGNQGLRACNGYRYEFHIGKGHEPQGQSGLPRRVQEYAEARSCPQPDDPLGGGNELLWQLTGGTETMTVTRDHRVSATMTTIATIATCVLGKDLPVLPNNHGPQTDRLVYGLGPFKGYDSGDATSREVGLYDQTFVDKLHPHSGQRRADHRRPVRRSLSARREGNLRPGQPEPRRSRRHPRRAPPARQGRLHRLQHLLDRAGSSDQRRLPGRHSAQRRALNPTPPTACCASGRASAARQTQTVDANNIITGLKGSGDWVQVGRNALPLFNAGLVGTQRQTLYLHTSPMKDVTNFGADILYPGAGARRRGARHLQGAGRSRRHRDHAQRTAPGHHQGHQPRRPIPIADGSTGDVITLDAAIDSKFPNGRRLGGGTAPNRNQVNVNSVLISLIVAGDRECRPGQGRRSQRQGLPRPVPVPRSRPSGSAAGTRRHQRSDRTEHPGPVA